MTGIDAQSYYQKDGAWFRRVSALGTPVPEEPPPPPPPPPPPTIRPTGPGYVTYEELYVSGNTLQQVFNKVSGTHAGKVLTFPAGEFTWSNFTSPTGWHDGIRIPTTCRGVAGSGIGVTRFRMVPNSSTEAAFSPTTSGTNPLYMWFQDNCTLSPLYQDFTFVGTEQGHYYNGLGIANSNNATFQRIKFHGANRGFSNFPPGETFSLGQNRCDNMSVLDCEFDNRDEITNVRVACSGLGYNNSSNAIVKRVYAHHGVSGMVTFWNMVNVQTEDVHTWSQGSGGGQLSSCGINHENVTGVIRHTRPKLIVAGRYSDQPLTQDSGLHFAFNNSFADMTDCEVYDPIFDKSENSSGCMSVHIIDNYPTQSIVTMPKVYFNGVLARSIDRNNPGSLTGVTPTNAWFRYH